MTQREQIARLETCRDTLTSYISALKGETLDHTGLGLWRIFGNQLEALGYKLVTLGQWRELTAEEEPK